MANFPTSAITFPTRSNGQTIDASHVQTLQDEVAAIEDGYLGGSARLNSSNSTVAKLSVTGGSTLAGAVVFGAGVASTVSFASSVTMTDLTVSGTLVVGGTAITGGRLPGCKVTCSSATMAIGGGVFAGFSWNAEEYDSTGIHSTGANSSRLALTSSGLWAFGGQVTAAIGTPPSTTIMAARVLANDNEAVAGAHVFIGSGGLVRMAVQVSGIYFATDTTAYLTLQGMQTSGSGMNAVGSTGGGEGPSHFWVQKVSG